MNIAAEIDNYRRGGFKRFKLLVADDGGFGKTDFVGGFDSLDEAKQALEAIEAERDRLVSEGWRLASDAEMRLDCCIFDRDNTIVYRSGS